MTPDHMAWLAARLREKSARFRKHADFLLNIVPGDPINNAAAKGLTADSDDFDHAADLIESMAQRVPLSDEQIRALVQPMDWPPSVTEIVRAVEQAHRIRSEG